MRSPLRACEVAAAAARERPRRSFAVGLRGLSGWRAYDVSVGRREDWPEAEGGRLADGGDGRENEARERAGTRVLIAHGDVRLGPQPLQRLHICLEQLNTRTRAVAHAVERPRAIGAARRGGRVGGRGAERGEWLRDDADGDGPVGGDDFGERRELQQAVGAMACLERVAASQMDGDVVKRRITRREGGTRSPLGKAKAHLRRKVRHVPPPHVARAVRATR